MAKTPQQQTVAGARLNLRQGPAPTFSIILVLNQGERVSLLGRNELATWAQVRTMNGTPGWVYAPLLQSDTVISTLPLAGTLPPTQAATTTGATAVISNAIYALYELIRGALKIVALAL